MTHPVCAPAIEFVLDLVVERKNIADLAARLVIC
jgi:hypothetical protein